MGKTNKMNNYEINRMLTLSKTMNPTQIGAEMGRSSSVIRKRLTELGAPMLKWCVRCEQNRGRVDFNGRDGSLCNRHEPKKQKFYEQDIKEAEALVFLREVAPLQALWTATPGEFRNTWATHYRG